MINHEQKEKSYMVYYSVQSKETKWLHQQLADMSI